MEKREVKIPYDGNGLFNSVLIAYVDAHDNEFPKTFEGAEITDQFGLRQLVWSYYSRNYETVKNLLKQTLIDAIESRNPTGFGKLTQEILTIININSVNDTLITDYIQGIGDGTIWGGGNELDILSKLLRIRIKIVNIERFYNAIENTGFYEVELKCVNKFHYHPLIFNQHCAVVAHIINCICKNSDCNEQSRTLRNQKGMNSTQSSSEDLEDGKLEKLLARLNVGDLIPDYEFFPRCEYHTRFERSTIFKMKDPPYWGTYFRSTSRGGNCDRYAKLFTTIEKIFSNDIINLPQKKDGQKTIKSYTAKTGAFRNPFYHSDYKNILLPREKCKKIYRIYFTSFSEDILYDQVLKYRQTLCEYFVCRKRMNTNNSKIFCYYENEYPCIIVCISIFEKKKRSIESWYQIAMSYFVAITNKLAVMNNIPIELVVRSSFNHNIPSVSSTKKSFRICVGMVPWVYIDILAQGLANLEVYFLSTLQDSFIKKEIIDEINQKIEKYNNGKEDKKQLPTWTQNLFKVLDLKGDASNKSVIAQITRKNEYLDLLINLVMEELNELKPRFEAPLIEMLKRIIYNDKITFDFPIKTFFDKHFSKKTFSDKENKEIGKDYRFWELLIKVYKSLGAECFNLKNNVSSKNLYGIYASLEMANLHFIRNSNYQSAEDGIGSDSECEGEDKDLEFYSRKIILSTGMRAINMAAFLIFYHISINTDVAHYRIDPYQMYYETNDGLETVTKSFFDIFNDQATIQSNAKDVVLLFDLNHNNANGTNVKNKNLRDILERIQSNSEKILSIVLDYTSATSDKICCNTLECLRKTDIVLLVNSGLKSEQMSADTNPYGTIRIIAREKRYMQELYNLAQQALKRSDEYFPAVAHQIRKSYKDAGLALTNKSIFGDKIKTVSSRMEEKKNEFEEQLFDYWEFSKYRDEIEIIMSRGYKKKEIIDLFRKDKYEFFCLASPDSNTD